MDRPHPPHRRRGPSDDVVAVLVERGLLEPTSDHDRYRMLQPERWDRLFTIEVEVATGG